MKFNIAKLKIKEIIFNKEAYFDLFKKEICLENEFYYEIYLGNSRFISNKLNLLESNTCNNYIILNEEIVINMIYVIASNMNINLYENNEIISFNKLDLNNFNSLISNYEFLVDLKFKDYTVNKIKCKSKLKINEVNEKKIRETTLDEVLLFKENNLINENSLNSNNNEENNCLDNIPFIMISNKLYQNKILN